MWAPFLFSDIYFLCFHNSTQPSVWEINCTVYYSTMCINSFGWVKIRTFKSWHQRTKKGVLGGFSTQSFSYFLGAEFPGKAVFEEQSEVHPCRTWGHGKNRRMGVMLQSTVLWQRSALERCHREWWGMPDGQTAFSACGVPMGALCIHDWPPATVPAASCTFGFLLLLVMFKRRHIFLSHY